MPLWPESLLFFEITSLGIPFWVCLEAAVFSFSHLNIQLMPCPSSISSFPSFPNNLPRGSSHTRPPCQSCMAPWGGTAPGLRPAAVAGKRLLLHFHSFQLLSLCEFPVSTQGGQRLYSTRQACARVHACAYMYVRVRACTDMCAGCREAGVTSPASKG